MRIALFLAAVAVLAGFLLARMRGNAVVSGAPGAPAVIPAAVPAADPAAPGVPAGASGGGSTSAASMTQPTLKTPMTVKSVPMGSTRSTVQPLAGAKKDGE